MIESLQQIIEQYPTEITIGVISSLIVGIPSAIITIFKVIKFVIFKVKDIKDNFTGLYRCLYTTWLKEDGTFSVTEEIVNVVKTSTAYIGVLLCRRKKRGQEEFSPYEYKKFNRRLVGAFPAKGKICDLLYIGTWYDPDDPDGVVGGFTLLPHINNENEVRKYQGQWSGVDRNHYIVKNGDWEWVRIGNRISMFTLFRLYNSKRIEQYLKRYNLRDDTIAHEIKAKHSGNQRRYRIRRNQHNSKSPKNNLVTKEIDSRNTDKRANS